MKNSFIHNILISALIRCIKQTRTIISSFILLMADKLMSFFKLRQN